MARERTLTKVEKDLAEGKLGIARDRLHGLVLAYPADLSIRSRLGDVYSKLGYPIDAGRFWFLDKDLTEDQQEAVDRFIKSCDNNPATILHRLKLRFDPDEVLRGEARDRIQEKIDECNQRNLKVPKFESGPLPPGPNPKLLTFACFSFLVIVGLLCFLGLVTLLQMVRGL